jgi:translation elongation factor EF-1alpha
MSEKRLHISVCGHVKHGKSTLAGRLAYELSALSDSQLRQYEQLAAEKGHDFNKYSLIFLQRQPPAFQGGRSNLLMDPSRTTVPEISGGMTLGDLDITIIDVPGHESFLDSIVYGAYLADAGVVVVDIGEGPGMMTAAALRILSTFRVPIVACCISKMDTVDFSQKRFEAVQELVMTQIKLELGEAGSRIPVLPISALALGGEGVSSAKEGWDRRFEWFKGPVLVELLKTCRNSDKSSEAKPRFLVEGRSEIHQVQGPGTVMVGVLEYGRLQVSQELIVEPASTIRGKKIVIRVKSIRRPNLPGAGEMSPPLSEVAAREILSVAFRNYKTEIALRDLKHGGVLGDPKNPPNVARKIEARLYFFEHDRVYSGKEYKIHPHGAWSMARLGAIRERELLPHADRDRIVERNSRQRVESFVTTGEAIVAELEFQRPMCIDPVDKFPRLGRFVVRDANRIVACGVCDKILASWPTGDTATQFPPDSDT